MPGPNGINGVNPPPVIPVNGLPGGAPVGGAPGGGSVGHVAQAVPPDAALIQVVQDGVGPDLNAGNGQGVQFAQNHAVAPSRDWDMTSAKGMLDTAQRALAGIKSFVTGKDALDAYDAQVGAAIEDALNGNPDGDAAALRAAYTELKTALAQVRSRRAALPEGIKDCSECQDPRKGLEQLLRHTRVFRYEMQKGLQAAGAAGGEMERAEDVLRGIQHTFTLGVKTLLRNEDVAGVFEAERDLLDKIIELRACLVAFRPGAQILDLPQEARFSDGVAKALELSHLTNNQIRDFQDADEATSKIRDIMASIYEKGGSRKVEFSVGAGALAGLGFPGVSLGVRLGVRVRIEASVKCAGRGKPVSVTYRYAGGGEVKAKAEALKESPIAGAKAGISGNAEFSVFTTHTYATLDDFILDAKNNKLATSRSFFDAVWGGVKSLGFSVGKLGTRFFRWLGRRADEVKQDNAAYLRTLKARNVAAQTDALLERRANVVELSKTNGKTWSVGGNVSASAGLGGGVVDLSAEVSASHAHDFGIEGRSFTPVARVIVDAADDAALNALIRPNPETGATAGSAMVYAGDHLVDDVERYFEECIETAEHLASGDNVGWARVANNIRSLMISVEATARAGHLPRAEADRLLVRFSNPRVKFPPRIFQEYFMDGTSSAKPSKVRNSFSASLKVGILSQESKDLTDGLSPTNLTGVDAVIEGTASDLVKEARHQIGLDTMVKYSFSSEKPAHPDKVSQPWEKAVKTSHSLTITASTPARVIIDAITKTVVNKGQGIDEGAGKVAGDITKDNAKELGQAALATALPGMIIASVKPATKAAVEAWLLSSDNVRQLVNYVTENANDPFDVILDAIEWAADGTNAGSVISKYVKGKVNLESESHNKTLTWSFVDGELDSFAVYTDTSNRIGVGFEPGGVGWSFSGDISFTVSQSVKERGYSPHPPLVALMERVAGCISSDSVREVGRPANPEAFKNWLASNFGAVTHTLATLDSDKNQEICAAALLNAPFDLQQEIQDAWHAAMTLPADATNDEKLNAVNELLVKLTAAYL